MNLLRRQFMKTATYVGAIAAVGSVALTPQRAIGAWNKDAFAARDVDSAISNAMGSSSHSPTDKITLKAPDIAENGAVVPITVDADMEGVELISIVASANATPLTSSYELSAASVPFVSTRIKMGETANVIAVVKAGGQLHSTSKEVKVTIGGCGG